MRPSYLEAMKQLGANPEAFSELLESVKFAVFVDHAELGCIYASEYTLSLFEMDWDTFKGFGWAAAVLPADMETLRGAIERYEIEKTTINVEYRIQCPSGALRALNVTGHAILDRDGNQLGSVMIGRDVTEERALADRALNAHKLEAIGRLGGRVAHDLNNVLTPIMCSAAILETYDLPDDARAQVEVIMQGAEHAAGISRQLLGLSRQDGHEAKLVCADAELTSLRSVLTPLLGERVELTLDLDAPRVVVGLAPHELGQVVLNLCVNARDAVGGVGRVEVRTRRDGQRLELQVHDTGPGISLDVQQRMFEPFFTTKPADRGTGLGLSTVQEIVRRAGGDVTVNSRLGSGTAITVRLPVLESQVERSSSRDATPQLKPLRILLVDDNSALRQTLAYVLALRQHTVQTSAGYRRATELLEAETFDVLVSDVLLTDGRGDELAQRALAAQPDIRVVFMSGFAGEDFDSSAVKSARCVFLQKPFHPNRVMSAICEVMTSSEETQTG
ncbi:MAG: ATP-binding protein [Nannocystaceae bacterium]|nr:ATP-binding protein [bacterium]